MVTTKFDFAREEGTCLVTLYVNKERCSILVMDQNASLDSARGGGARNPWEPSGRFYLPLRELPLYLRSSREMIRSRRILCGSGGGASWEAVLAFC